jgi:predicted ester cyclase
MSTEHHKALVRRWLEGYNNNPLSETSLRDELFTPDLVAHFPGFPPLNREAHEQVAAMFARSFSDYRLTVDDQVAEGDRVATRWTWSMTHSGDFQGIPATDRRITIKGIGIDRFVEGKIVEHWVNMDQVGMLQQLGVIPAPEQAAAA